MRLLATAVATASALALAAAASAAPGSDRSTFEGRVAAATWDACGAEGCWRTTVSVRVGTYASDEVEMPVRNVVVRRHPNPMPSGVASRVLVANPQNAAPVIAEDLSSASWAGETLVFRQDCSDEGVCFPGSTAPVGLAHVDASWAATGPRRRFHARERHEVTNLIGERCVTTTTTNGWRRPADASLVISILEQQEPFTWPLGTLESASIDEVRSRTLQRCSLAAG